LIAKGLDLAYHGLAGGLAGHLACGFVNGSGGASSHAQGLRILVLFDIAYIRTKRALTKDTSGLGACQQKISPSRASEPSGAGASPLVSCGDFDIRIARDGTWFYRGSPIARKALVKLFAGVLKRDDSGDFWLITPAERGRILVDDAPFTAVECRPEGAGNGQVLRFRTNLDDWVEAGPQHPIRVEIASDTGEPRPYIEVRDRLDALIVRSVFYQLVDLAEERRLDKDDGEAVLGLWSKGAFFPLGRQC
jgi:hypothetical protein